MNIDYVKMKICGSDFFPVKALKWSSFLPELVVMDDKRNFDCLRVVLLPTEILRAINSFSVVYHRTFKSLIFCGDHVHKA